MFSAREMLRRVFASSEPPSVKLLREYIREVVEAEGGMVLFDRSGRLTVAQRGYRMWRAQANSFVPTSPRQWLLLQAGLDPMDVRGDHVNPPAVQTPGSANRNGRTLPAVTQPIERAVAELVAGRLPRRERAVTFDDPECINRWPEHVPRFVVLFHESTGFGSGWQVEYLTDDARAQFGHVNALSLDIPHGRYWTTTTLTNRICGNHEAEARVVELRSRGFLAYQSTNRWRNIPSTCLPGVAMSWLCTPGLFNSMASTRMLTASLLSGMLNGMVEHAEATGTFDAEAWEGLISEYPNTVAGISGTFGERTEGEDTSEDEGVLDIPPAPPDRFESVRAAAGAQIAEDLAEVRARLASFRAERIVPLEEEESRLEAALADLPARDLTTEIKEAVDAGVLVGAGVAADGTVTMVLPSFQFTETTAAISGGQVAPPGVYHFPMIRVWLKPSQRGSEARFAMLDGTQCIHPHAGQFGDGRCCWGEGANDQRTHIRMVDEAWRNSVTDFCRFLRGFLMSETRHAMYTPLSIMCRRVGDLPETVRRR